MLNYQVRARGIQQVLYRFKVGASAGTEQTQQKSQGTLRPATTCLGPGDLYNGLRSEGVIRMDPVGFIRLIQVKS